MRSARLWARLLGVEKTTVEKVEYDEDAQVLVAHVKPHERERRRCPTYRRRCPVYDRGEGRRRWRALDLGAVVVELEADAPRISCPEHGMLVAAVPWARHHAGHTRFFDDQVAWLAVQTSKTAVTKLMRIAWRTVGAIIARVVADIDAGVDRLEGPRRIGIDEISYKKGYRYGVIVGYTAIIDAAALGQGFEVIINADIVAKDRDTVEAFEARVAAMDEVVELRRMFGLPDYLMRVRVADPAAYERWLMGHLLGDPAIARVDSRMTMKTLKSRK